jgi:regulator of chromosome condensation
MRKRKKEFLLPGVTPGYCFTLGTNGFGALGLGEDVVEKFRAAHVDVAGKRLLGVACGGMHTVALAEDGSIYTWGVNDEGALGRPTSGTAWEAEPDSSKEDPYVPGMLQLTLSTTHQCSSTV